MMVFWAIEVEAQIHLRPDLKLAQEGLQLYRELSNTTDTSLRATDLNAGNVLKANPAPWLMIDPKPYIGDPRYDATQYLINCRGRLAAKPHKPISNHASQAQKSTGSAHGPSPDWRSEVKVMTLNRHNSLRDQLSLAKTPLKMPIQRSMTKERLQ